MSSSEWRRCKLRDLGNLARGKSKHRPRDAAFLYGGKYPFIQTGDIKAANHNIFSYNQTYSEAGLNQSKLWPIGTIVITIAANIGDTGILTFPACFPDSVLGFTADEEQCNIDFMEYLLQFYKRQIQSHAIGSVQDNINLATFENVEFIIPSLPTQRRIASILSSLDEKIELNRQTNATLEAMAQAIFKEWFVNFNFPGATGEMVESELGPIPRGWRISPLDEIAHFLNGLALQKFPPEDEISYLSVLKIRELKNGITSSSDKASRNIPQQYVIDDGDLIFSWSGTLEVKFWIGGKCALNQHLFKVTSNKYPLWFCYFGVLHHLEEFRNIAEEKTTTMGHIKREHITNALCLVPGNLEYMDKFISPIFREMSNYSGM